MATVGINGISHITFIVGDLDRTSRMLQHIFDAREIYSSGDETYSYSKEKYFLVNGIWLAIMEGDPLPERTYDHIAFKISEEDYNDYLE